MHRPFFKDISEKIIECINTAQDEILVAVAWFTNENIANALVRKVQIGVSLRLVIMNDKNNQKIIEKFSSLKGKGQIKITLLPENKYNLMHNKFCVIDNSIYITGSYNWTTSAQGYDENIIVVKDKNTALNYFWTFCELEKKKVPALDKLINILENIDTRDTFSLVSSFTHIHWSTKLIEKYKSYWDWERLSSNTSLPWSIELIEKYENYWNWTCLSSNISLPWSIELIEKYENYWNFEDLSFNSSCLWFSELIEQYEYKLCLEGQFFNSSNSLFCDVTESSCCHWTEEKLLFNTSYFWSIELIEKYKEYLDWERLSSNTTFPWSIEFIEKYKEYLDWDRLSYNTSLPWSIEFIEKYSNFLNFYKLIDCFHENSINIFTSIHLPSHYIYKILNKKKPDILSEFYI